MSVDQVSLEGINRTGRELVRGALQLGWTARNTNGGAVLLRIEHEGRYQTITIPTGSIREGVVRTTQRKIGRYADPVKRAIVGMHVENADAGGPQTYSDGPGVRGMDELTVESEYHVAGEPEKPAPTIVSESPHMAKKSTGEHESQRYQSKTTVERKWSDGSVDYACALADCDYTNPVPTSVARHYGRSADHPEVEKPKEFMADAPYTPKVTTFGQRVDRLARELAAAIEAVQADLTPADSTLDIGMVIATRMLQERDRRNERDSDAPAEPLTAEQKLERIRRLVDDGSYLRAIEAEREQAVRMDELTRDLTQNNQLMQMQNERIEELEQQRDAALADAKKAQDQWDALASLIAEAKGA